MPQLVTCLSKRQVQRRQSSDMLIGRIGVGASSFLAVIIFFASTNSDESPELNILCAVLTGYNKM